MLCFHTVKRVDINWDAFAKSTHKELSFLWTQMHADSFQALSVGHKATLPFELLEELVEVIFNLV